MSFNFSLIKKSKLIIIAHKIQQYWSGSAVNKNKGMVENLQRSGIITSRKVAEVMENIDRGLFVPSGVQPYIDSPMAIGYNVTISAPHMHAACLQLLENHLQPGMHALDVGSGILSPLTIYIHYLRLSTIYN